ncbi:MAG: hypothetical protein DDT25_00591 [Chloroflexi bacterium]|nr:hypothetical protein [Chloroflexota bacterium]
MLESFADYSPGSPAQYGHIFRVGMCQHGEMNKFFYDHDIGSGSRQHGNAIDKEGVLSFSFDYSDVAIGRMLVMDHLFTRPLAGDREPMESIIPLARKQINKYS